MLLLDEPLSALDLKLRQHMRNELRAIQRRVGITFIYITHDQGEALTMSDRIAVMNRSMIEQVSDGRTLYNHPRTAFVASFVGENNAFVGTVRGMAEGPFAVDGPLGALPGVNVRKLIAGSAATLFVRPEHFRLTNGQGIAATVAESAFEGNVTNLTLIAASGIRLTVTLVGDAAKNAPDPGAKVHVTYRPEDGLILPTEG